MILSDLQTSYSFWRRYETELINSSNSLYVILLISSFIAKFLGYFLAVSAIMSGRSFSSISKSLFLENSLINCNCLSQTMSTSQQV